MAFGIDTFRSRLDLLPAIAPAGNFFVWNGGARPQFAGRHLLGRNALGPDFIWAHAEATNASTEPDGNARGGRAHFPLPAGDPSPEHPENLTLSVDRLAPIQAPQPARQQFVDDKGRLFGQIDADAICKRLVAAVLTGELGLSDAQLMHVWLSVDPGVPFTEDYWAGWADTVNNYVLPVISQGTLLAQLQPFRAGIICSYVAGADGKLRPEPHVLAALATTRWGGNTSVHGLWADVKLWDNAPADLVANGSPLLDWNGFDPPTAPVLWRFAHGFTLANGAAAGLPFDIDAASPMAQPLDFMFQPQTWQPNVPTIQTLGFSNSDSVSAQIACLQGTPLPDLDDNNFAANSGHFHLPGGYVKVIGRYVRHNHALSMTRQEAQDLSNASFSVFTIWESARALAGMGAFSEPSLDDATPVQNWGPFTAKLKKYIYYFNPDPDGNPATHDDAGTQDGTDAFQYCGATLKQPPQTPIFFAIDFDPYDVLDPNNPPAPLLPPPAPAAPPGWPALPAVAVREQWIKSYFENIKTARDAYSTQTGRHYLIGVYGPGKIMQLLYEQGIVSHFWQSGGSGHTGSKPPLWPWYHANRWQYRTEQALCGINGIDPDADWGDGGAWSLTDSLSQDFEELERSGSIIHFVHWGELLVPPPPPPPPPQ
jgi:hypothetical protein